MTGAMPSPCVGICEMTPDGAWCTGCARTADEITAWSSMDNDGKRALLVELAERRARIGMGVPVLGHPVAVLDRVLLGSLDKAGAKWAIGVPGATATFCPGDGTLVTARLWEYGGDAIGGYGGTRVVLDHKAKQIKAIGTLGPDGETLTRIDLCVYARKGLMSQRRVLTEIGLDTEALRVGDRRGVLFDLGLGLAHIDFCARVDDEDLLALMRAEAGKPVLDPASPVLAALEEAQAHRVALTRLGRIESWGRPPLPPEEASPCSGTRIQIQPEVLAQGLDREPGSPVPATLHPVITLFPGQRVGLV
ncbi:DUF1289 domain-containing protein [Pararhodospirillum oryzae]|uniref:DUF1289 domain-containing protein n=1 Tax=Pararhodospirillum oryzae TaxID=478448 RepID=A0A512H680_9PROT|nr:DUF1289 domain-containing protein [Pararhodospirillum oryzae]GEO80928.1 DUF1289 domain-containing protein [Pararhodospirillum oryzae]